MWRLAAVELLLCGIWCCWSSILLKGTSACSVTGCPSRTVLPILCYCILCCTIDSRCTGIPLKHFSFYRLWPGWYRENKIFNTEVLESRSKPVTLFFTVHSLDTVLFAPKQEKCHYCLTSHTAKSDSNYSEHFISCESIFCKSSYSVAACTQLRPKPKCFHMK